MDRNSDLEAQPTATADRGGSGSKGPGHMTGDASAGASETKGETPLTGDGGLDDLTVKDANDPDLGLTGIGSIPADDWAADTGPTKSTEAEAPHHKR